MDIWQIDKLVLFLIVFMPGFISIKIYDLLVPAERRDFSSSIFEVVGYSALNFAALSWLIIFMHSGKFYDAHKIWYFIFLFFILFIAPIFWPILWLKLISLPRIAQYVVSPIQKPWDFVFGKRKSYWIIVHLKDGRAVGGKFAEASSASTYPADEQIYLEEVWQIDENRNFIKPIERSKGIIILGDEIRAIEFFK